MKLVLRPYVEHDIDTAATWYEERRPGLKRGFVEEVEAALSRIQHNPFLYAVVHLDMRRAPLRRFPYGIYYALIREEIHVLAVVGDSRHPSIWQRRR
jgi:toxin ParE1/3/4